jgi:hypothetical protein
VVQLEVDAERPWEPPRAPSSEPIATGMRAAIITGVMVVVGCAPAEDLTPYLLGTAGNRRSVRAKALLLMR